MIRNRTCPKCNIANPGTARFCGGCGHILDEVLCEVCGKSNGREFKFCIHCGTQMPGNRRRESSHELKIAAAQRRLLTIMFCDLVDSTGMTQALDPERLRTVIRDFQGSCEEVIGEYGGRITERLGDGVVVQFTGHENSAERAVRSALDIINTVSDTKVSEAGLRNDSLAVRCGIATGVAIVGDHLGEGDGQIESSIGIPPTLAKRIEGLAQPNELLISDKTRNLIGGLFQCQDFGWHRLKGFVEPLRVWRVVAEENVDFRFEATGFNILSLVDREEVMETIMRRWDEAREGRGQVVVLSGEPGIGKSRIVEEVDRRLAEMPHMQLRYQCSPYHTNTALYPVIARVSRAAGFQPDDGPQTRFNKLEHYLRETQDDVERAAPIYASILSLPTSERYAQLELPPAELRQQMLSLILRRAQQMSEHAPLLVQIEDVHWIDPTSLELLNTIVHGAKSSAILLLVTARPQFSPDFVNLPHVTLQVVNRLPESYTRELVQRTWASFGLPESYVEEIVNRSEGIPLFAEELSKTIIENLRQGLETLAGVKIPATLQDSLLARLDNLGEAARATAQVASAIGREFSTEVLVAAIGAEKEKIMRRVDELVRAEVVGKRSGTTGETMLFKHALMQEAAYESLLQSDRMEIHRRIAVVVEEQYPAMGESSPEMLAHHWSEAGAVEKAIPYWLAAGRRASERFANKEAVNHLNRGLDLLQRLPQSTERDEKELELRVAIGPVLRVSEGTSAKITRSNIDRAIELCDVLPESPAQFAALWGKWQNSINYKRELGLEWTDRLQQLAEKLGSPGYVLQAHHAQWTTLFHIGHFAEAYQHIRQGLQCYDGQAHRHHASLYGGHDPRVCGAGFAAHSLWMLGFPDQALAYLEKCITWGESLKQTGSMLHVVELCSLLYQFRRESEKLVPWLDRLEEICEKNQLPEYLGKLDFNRGWFLADSGDREAGVNLMQKGVDQQSSIGSYEDLPMFYERLAHVLSMVGEKERALRCLDRAEEIADAYSLRYWLAEVYRRRGTILQQQGERVTAKTCLTDALEISQRQEAKSLELRARMSLARWEIEYGTPATGLHNLQAVYTWFSEGLNSPDLVAARALMQDLQGYEVS